MRTEIKNFWLFINYKFIQDFIVPKENDFKIQSKHKDNDKFVEGSDYYFDQGLMVLTARFLLKRGYCCDNGCRHCPYPKEEKTKS